MRQYVNHLYPVEINLQMYR